MPLLTIFTPTYNRGYSLPRLYDSLCQQTSGDFEWLVVDDGSTDSTEQLVKGFISEQKIPIRYIKQSNGGKHRAINLGVKEANGDLFFIVDSDDWLNTEAIVRITAQFDKISNNNEFAGVCGLKAYADGNRIGGESDFDVLECSSLFRYQYNVLGDMAEVIRTNVLRKYPFPEYEGEKYCPESLVWNRIALKYKLRYFNEIVYLCEYLPDGLTAKSISIRHQSPMASSQYYSELTRMPIPLIYTIKGAVNYWRFRKPYCNQFRLSFLLNIIGFLPGKLMRCRDKYNNRRRKSS